MSIATPSRRLAGVIAIVIVAMVAVVAWVVRDNDVADPCGPKVTKADGSAWECTFSDDFNGTTLDPSRWLAQKTSDSDYTIGGDCFLGADPDNVAVKGGSLLLTTRREEEALTCQGRAGTFTTPVSSGMVTTHGRFAQTYGRIEFRVKFPHPTGQGVHSALWMFPQEQAYGAWPNSGEIDVAELFSVYPDRAIPRLHYPNVAGEAELTSTDCLVSKPWRFHTYTAQWDAQGITVEYDGRKCFTAEWKPAPPLEGSQPFDRSFMIALTQGIGVPGTANAYIDGTTALPATMEVDYVRVWE